MNILLVVTTMLMLLAMMTYARIEMFRSFSTTQALFEHYIQNTEHVHTNQQAEVKYNQLHVKRQDKEKQEKEEATIACSKISFAIFLDRSNREGNPRLLADTVNVTRNLIEILYKGHPFYNNIIEKNPDFVKDILDRITKIADTLKKGKKITHTKGLAKLDLGDPDLNKVFTDMLEGNPSPNGNNKQETKEAYPSLLEYITLKRKFKIRVYLASENLLNALFEPGVAKAIIEKRQLIYSELDKKIIDAKEGEKQLADAFADLRRPDITDAFLSFEVSKTNPKNYVSPQ